MASPRNIEQSLSMLAKTAWSTRRIVPSSDFVLRPERLSQPHSVETMTEAVTQLYKHARTWAPGFEIPYRVPKVSVSSLIDSAGQYRADEDGYLFIEIARGFLGSPEAILAILAHESSHHILDLSGIRGSSGDERERLTDLAAFICGFGELILQGHSKVRRVGSAWTQVHLGYHSSEEYRSTQRWVLRVQNLSEVSDADLSRGVGLMGRIRRWFRASKGRSGGSPEGRIRPHVDMTGQRRQDALTRLGGNRQLLERLVEHERRRNPTGNELALLDSVIERLERDRR
jgi:hypothetical protein